MLSYVNQIIKVFELFDSDVNVKLCTTIVLERLCQDIDILIYGTKMCGLK